MRGSAFQTFADAIEGGAAPRDVAGAALKKHERVIFNGDNYDEANQEALTAAGVWRIDSGVEAICRYSEPKTKELFSKVGADDEQQQQQQHE